MTESPQHQRGSRETSTSSPKNGVSTAKGTRMKKPSWWNLAQLKGDAIDKFGPTGRMLLDQAMTTGKTVFAGSCRGILEDDDEEGQKAFMKALVELTGAGLSLTSGPIFGRGVLDTWLTFEDGAVSVQIGLDGKLSVGVLCLNEEMYMSIAKVLGDFLLPDHVRQPVYSLADGRDGVEIVEVGLAGSQFEKENYEEEVVEGFDFIVSELQRDPPLGRLVILEGEPGSGKTFFVRGIIHEVLDAIFVLVPPHLVDSLAGPQLVPMLVRARGMAGSSKPIVLVIEDADKALVPREEGSLAAISALLNVSDGILGHALNIRIVTTTNASIEEIDEALKRPGRLSKHLNIGLLSPEKASEVYARITEGEEVDFEGPVSLAQVYQFALAEDIAEEDDGDEDDEDDDDDDDEDDDEDDE